MNKRKTNKSISQIKFRHIAAFIYICVFMTAISLYMTKGYLMIDVDKYNAFKCTSAVGIPLWLLGVIIDLFLSYGKKNYIEEISNCRSGKWFAILFLVAAIVSSLTSRYREQTITGYYGWYMGLLSLAVIFVLYIIVEDFIRNSNTVWCRAFIIYIMCLSMFVLILGIFNRYSIFPFGRIRGHQEDFISTIGNINWFSEYWCLWTGICCGLFLRSKKNITMMFTGLLVWICAAAGVSCGSDSAYLGWGMISFISFLVLLEKREWILKWCMMEVIAVSVLPGLRIVGAFRPNRMWYDSDWLQGVTYGNSWIKIFVVAVIFFYIIGFLSDVISKYHKVARVLIITMTVSVALATGMIFVMNNLIEGGIWPVRGISLFYFSDDWGNTRGAIWKASFWALCAFEPFGIFFGVGCDCFSSFVYSLPQTALYLDNHLGGLKLTNAHNEYITMLINEGIFGLVVYVGMEISHIRYAFLAHNEDGFVLGAMLAICGYMTIGMVGFMELLSTPFLFIIMGILAGLTNRPSLNTIS